jgi:drug/metabolite transporter (DMT)-like permease
MSVPIAYLGVILIWGTTPLTIQWSGEGGGFLFGVAARMVIGLVLALTLLTLVGGGLKRDGRSLRAYLIAGLGIFSTMMCVYWAAQYIPSGWISVIFGLSPILTGIMARYWLASPPLTPLQWGGLACALAGLTSIFGTSLELSGDAVNGLVGVLVATLGYAASAVGVKRVNAQLSGLNQAAGGLLVATPLFVSAWWLGDGALPSQIPLRTGGSILYLALFGSVVGFAAYYHVLRHVEAVRVTLITLVTPVIALLLGALLNDEAITREVMIGAVLILSGLALFQFGPTCLKPVALKR